MKIETVKTERAEHAGSPVADRGAVVVSGQARFTVLTPALVRMEWSPASRFEDRASFAFVNRQLAVPTFTSKSEDGWLVIATDELTVRYKKGSGKFAPDNLRVELTVGGKVVVWKPGTLDTGNLGGTTRTLDGVSGACPIDKGLLSRDGWCVVDDSQRLLFDSETGWAVPRSDGDAIDWYFFGYGRDYKRELGDFIKVAGRIPLPPRYVFGTWWSRYWAYSDEQLRQLVREFDEHDVPLDVLVVDMDWHLDGWTGYTWNPKYFPDPGDFLKWMHERGLRVTLNLHPHSGVGKQEAMFDDFAKFMGLDPNKVDRVPFDCADPKYMEAYFKFLHHPQERAGIDFWWMDWQQGEETKIAGLDPLFWLNHLHWRDMASNPDRDGLRPLIFSRWGGLGNHRYQVGFSGDTFCNWASLAFQPYFTSTAGNVGYAYWSHDIGGHQPGAVDPELYTRWVQFGVFSPVLRTHTTKNPLAERRIWEFPKEYFEAMREAFRLRYELIPYIYTMARKCYDTGIPLCRPLYYEWPELDEAYEHPGQYMFGDDLLVAPITKPANPVSGVAEAEVWLPPGRWINWFTDAIYDGPCNVAFQVALDEVPVFAREGAIIPTAHRMDRSAGVLSSPLILHVFPGQSGEFELYEDDGQSSVSPQGEAARTRITQAYEGERMTVTIHPTEGKIGGLPSERGIEIRLHAFAPGLAQEKGVFLNGEPVGKATEPGGVGWGFDTDAMCFVVRLTKIKRTAKTEVSFDIGRTYAQDSFPGNALRGRMRAIDDVEAMIAFEPTTDETIAARIKRELGERHAYDKSVAGSMSGWAATLLRVQSAELSPELRTKALMRLLGLVASLDATAVAEPKTHVRLSATLSLGAYVPPLGTFVEGVTGEWSATVRLDEAEHWRMASPGVWKCGSESQQTVLQCGGELVPVDGLQTTRLRGTIDVAVAGTRIGVPVDMVLLPSINRWWIVGPFDAPSEDRLQTVFDPEKKLDLEATYAGKGGKKIGWQKVERTLSPDSDLADEFFVEFHKVFGTLDQDAVAYAVTYLRAPREMDVSLAVGSDDGVAIWLNDDEVYRHDIGRPYTSKEDRVAVTLKKGANKLMLKISQGGGMWSFSMHVETLDGQPLPELTTHLEP